MRFRPLVISSAVLLSATGVAGDTQDFAPLDALGAVIHEIADGPAPAADPVDLMAPSHDGCPDSRAAESARLTPPPLLTDWDEVDAIVGEARSVLDVDVPAAIANIETLAQAVPVLSDDDIESNRALAADLEETRISQLEVRALMSMARERTRATLVEVAALKARTFGGADNMVLIDDVAGVLRDPELMLGGQLSDSR